MRTSMQILDFDTRDKGRCLCTTGAKRNSSPSRGLGYLYLMDKSVNASPLRYLASLPPSITVPLSPVIAMTQVTKLASLS